MYQWARFSSDSRRGEAYIGLGLAVLIAGPWWPNAPFVTAVAIICLGATLITLARFHDKPALLLVTVLHATAYMGLYALFVGATLQMLAAKPTASLSRLAMLDLTISAVPMTIALKRISSSLWQSTLSRR